MNQRRGGFAVRAWTQVRSALWPLPSLAVAVAIALGILLPDLDARLDVPEGAPLAVTFGGGPSAARDLLAVIAGSLISVTGLVFSLTVVTLQLASSQYSPRLLQTFATDRVVQITLAQLSATFVYSLTVLRTVRTESATEGETAFVPRLAITLAYLLAIGSVLALLFFLGHLARSLRVETMLRDVHDEALPILDREVPHTDGTAANGSGGPAGPRPGDAIDLPTGRPDIVCADSGGFVTDVDEQRLVAAAVEADAVVLLDRRIGDPVVEGVPIAHVWRRRAGSRAEPDGLDDALRKAVVLQYERSTGRDIAYSLRKVVDIAVRALSPGINDPTTAVHALSHISAMLGELLQRPLHPRCLDDDEGQVRLVIPQWDAEALFELALEEPLLNAEGQPAVLRRMAALLREVAWRSPDGLLADRFREQLARIDETARASTGLENDEIGRWRSDLEDALAGRWALQHPPRQRTQG